MSDPCQCGGTCGCCEGVEALTPLDTANRPGLDALRYRVGTHSAFFETMKARLSSQGHPELAGLTTREESDPSLALLDAWATAADVLTFYQERIANEGYLRTATERRSVRELARLIGYELRPGVAASTWLAFTLDPGPEVVIPAGSRAQSVPGPGELPQPFETEADLVARAAWNQLPVRLTRPQLGTDARRNGVLYFKGISTLLKVNDPLLIRTVQGAKPVLHRVKSVEPDAVAGRTRVTFEPWLPLREILQAIYRTFSQSGKDLGDARVEQAYADLEDLISGNNSEPEIRRQLAAEFLPALRTTRTSLPAGPVKQWFDDLIDELEMAAPGPPDPAEPQVTDISKVLDSLAKPPSVPPASPARVARASRRVFDAGSDSSARLLLATRPELRKVYYKAWANVPVAKPPVLEVWALRLRASAFGHNAPLPLQPNNGVLFADTGDWTLTGEAEKVAVLDTSYPQILPGSWIALERSTAIDGSRLVITTVEQVAERSRAAYGIAGKSTQATLRDRWLNLDTTVLGESEEPPTTVPGDTFEVIRGTAIFAHSEPLELAETPIPEPLCKGDLELAGLFDGLEPGRWLIVAGERADVVATENVTDPDGTESAAKIPVPGIPAAELVMVAEVRQGAASCPGESTHTTLVLASELAYCYRRDTVVVWGNVAPATHGETKSEILGSGRAAEPLQRFTLKQAPLTQVSAPTPSGIESTLRVRVNDVLWHEAPSLFGLAPTDHVFTTRIDEEGATTVIFGDGKRGARLPTGAENVRAVYRVGIGKPGNLDEKRISQLVTRPLGVKDVINPLPATGGADAESRDQARRNAPLAVMALDRLVSVQDYADFARTFAGVGRASATRISNGRTQLVHVTIAGEDDIPITLSSELFANLEAALRQFGDPHLPVQLAVREASLLVIAAGVRLLPDYLWEAVVPKIRAALLGALGFERRDLAQTARLSEAVAAIQSVPGVDFVDVDLFDNVAAAPDFKLFERIAARPARRDPKTGQILPAQLVYLSPAVPDLILLKEIPS